MTRDETVKSMRTLHFVFLAAIVGYAWVAERFFIQTKDVPVIVVAAFSVCAFADVMIAQVFRQKRLVPAIQTLKRDGNDAPALAAWRAINTLSMVLVMSVALMGLGLRAQGCSREIVWPFFIASLILMLAWKPKLDDGAVAV